MLDLGVLHIAVYSSVLSMYYVALYVVRLGRMYSNVFRRELYCAAGVRVLNTYSECTPVVLLQE